MMDDLEKRISTLKAERDVARHELAERIRLIEEIRAAVTTPGDAPKIIAWLVSRLEHSRESY
ncbi:hypothetical protein [Bradyrhizobium betae]|uniref:Uncharacterized protein n=1 Tax=Bradyrhizobium betae TaxID=244734 RepID=A0A5P6PB14_9BRAD|nr:hypothetical protein [Bradyrhizobium betae]MCS3726506.1 hypothetical protein [Bradyrhizobium betae]QFI75501.1 hypothetical protein F8237_25760 [Bradyrhizobium betae]